MANAAHKSSKSGQPDARLPDQGEQEIEQKKVYCIEKHLSLEIRRFIREDGEHGDGCAGQCIHRFRDSAQDEERDS